MESRKSSLILAMCAVVCAACSLLQDPDSLTSGNRPAMVAAGAGGIASSNGGAGGADCTPGTTDTSCDGLDRNCAPTLSEAVCPAGCKGIRYNAESYMACTVSASFSDAETLCEQQGMKLAQIDSASENAFVAQTAQSLGSYIWIGGSDLTSLGIFRWQNGTAFFQNGAAISGVYSSFAAGEPSSLSGLDCVQLHDDATGPWSSAKCGDQKQFVCER